jgi:hypothetical protein
VQRNEMINYWEYKGKGKEWKGEIENERIND